MNKIIKFKCAIFPLLIFSSPLALANNVINENLDGIWQVKHVYIDSTQMSRSDFLSDDPNLVGRTVNFSTDKISGEMLVSEGCSQPSFIIQPKTALNSLIALTNGTEKNDSLADNYSLKQQGNHEVTPIVIQCVSGIVGPTGEATGNWLAMLDKQTMLINWDSNSLLELQKIPADAVALPSFNCQRAATAPEKAICSSFDLSAWDRSVSIAYKMATAQIKMTGVDVPEKLTSLKKAQNKWLTLRDACKDDKSCIKKQLVSRVSDLVEEIK
ncbi:MAG: lysozyme inhibitor LprI family protein [Mixta sp.]